MKAIIKIESLALSKLNNSEFLYFMNRVLLCIKMATLEKLGIEEADFQAFEANITQMTDIVNQSQASRETRALDELDKLRDKLLTFFLDYVNTMSQSPIAQQQEAAENLERVMKAYKDIRRKPNKQETQDIRGLIVDLAKEDVAAHVTVLGLAQTVADLKKANEDYEALTLERSNSQQQERLGPAKPLRIALASLYEYFTVVAFAQSVAVPSAENAKFVADLNKAIEETKQAYNLRTAIPK